MQRCADGKRWEAHVAGKSSRLDHATSVPTFRMGVTLTRYQEADVLKRDRLSTCPDRVCPLYYVRRSEDRLCEPALYVELLTVRPCGEKDGKGIENSSLLQRGLRSLRTQNAGPAIMPLTPALTAVRAPRTSWPGPQPLLRRTPKEAPPAGAAQTLLFLHSTQAVPVTLCVQLYADPSQQIPQIPDGQAGLAFALRTPRRPGNYPRALPSQAR